MSSLRRYLHKKLQGVEFGKRYRDFCEVCPVTVRIVGMLTSDNVDPPQLARETGIPEADIVAFIDGDRCSYEIASRIGTLFGMEPENCPRKPV